MLVRVLLVCDAPALRRRILRLAGQRNVVVSHAGEDQGLWEGLSHESCDLVVAERASLPDAAGDLVAALRKLPDRPDVIVLQGRDDAEERAALLAAGCMAVVSLDLADAQLGRTLSALINRRRETALSRLRGEQVPHLLSDFASSSPAMQELLGLARRVAASDSSLLIEGETGVGKEWLARAVHAEGPRSASPFVAVNCAAVPETLLESELFGHERGAFTGASRSRRGYFELAHRGTIFLDEIADMQPHLQAKLLRVLQERKIQRVGGEEPLEVDVRIMAATNRNLEEALAAGVFRKDLYYRLSVVRLTIPPLRQRREDIPNLVETYLNQFRVQLRSQVAGIHPGALEALLRYTWPGNVRELINVIERAVLLCHGGEIGLEDLPEGITAGRSRAPAAAEADGALRLDVAAWLDRPLRELRREAARLAERAYLTELLHRTGGQVGRAAARAGLDPRSLYDKMKALGLRKEDFRPRPEPPSASAASATSHPRAAVSKEPR